MHNNPFNPIAATTRLRVNGTLAIKSEKMRTFILAMLTMAVSACVHTPRGPLTDGERQAIKSAEAFILRHGYTASGHPAGLPVENVEVMDSLAERSELVQWRNGSLEARAFGVTVPEENACYVLFHRIHSKREFRAVLVQRGEAVQVVHSVLLLNKLQWKANDR